jgi:predicted phage terminase large subunit-like protein
MGRHKDGTFWVLDVARARLGPKGVRQLIRQTAEVDGRRVAIRVEREGGASGKIAAQSIVADDLAGWPAAAVRPEGSKAERAEPWGSQIEAGNAAVVRAGWNAAFLDEHRQFPLGDHDDQVDAASGAFRCLTRSQVNIR